MLAFINLSAADNLMNKRLAFTCFVNKCWSFGIYRKSKREANLPNKTCMSDWKTYMNHNNITMICIWWIHNTPSGNACFDSAIRYSRFVCAIRFMSDKLDSLIMPQKSRKTQKGKKRNREKGSEKQFLLFEKVGVTESVEG